jgi:hypothetical protein
MLVTGDWGPKVTGVFVNPRGFPEGDRREVGCRVSGVGREFEANGWPAFKRKRRGFEAGGESCEIRVPGFCN